MSQYISDNTDDEISHAQFLNAYLMSKGAEPVNLDAFRNLPSSQATGAAQVGRLTNVMKLTVDTSWWTRYRSRQNPDFGATFPNVVPTLAVGQHPAIPRNDAENAALSDQPIAMPGLGIRTSQMTATFRRARFVPRRRTDCARSDRA
jgi:hypothetical protein